MPTNSLTFIVFLFPLCQCLPLSRLHPDFIALESAFSNVTIFSDMFLSADNHCVFSWVTCDNATNNTLEINIPSGFWHAKGTFNSSALPKSLKKIWIENTQMTGTINTNEFPLLNYLDITGNKFFGTIEIPNAPSKITYISFDFNNFDKIVFPLNWPKYLKTLRLEFLPRAISGPNIWENFRSSFLSFLWMRGGNLTGSFRAHNLPATLERLYVNGVMSGVMNLTQLPTNLTHLGISRNKFTSIVFPSSFPRTLHSFQIPSNLVTPTSVPWSAFATCQNLRFIYLNSNGFIGSVDYSQLPASLQYLYLFGNSFSGTIDVSTWSKFLQLRDIRLQSNNFVGPIRMDLLPKWIQRVRMDLDVYCDAILCNPNFAGGVTGRRIRLSCGSTYPIPCNGTCNFSICAPPPSTAPTNLPTSAPVSRFSRLFTIRIKNRNEIENENEDALTAGNILTFKHFQKEVAATIKRAIREYRILKNGPVRVKLIDVKGRVKKSEFVNWMVLTVKVSSKKRGVIGVVETIMVGNEAQLFRKELATHFEEEYYQNYVKVQEIKIAATSEWN